MRRFENDAGGAIELRVIEGDFPVALKFERNTGNLYGFCLSPDGTRVMVMDPGPALRVLSLDAPGELITCGNGMRDACFLPNGEIVMLEPVYEDGMSARQDVLDLVHRSADGDELSRTTIGANTASVDASPDGKMLVVASSYLEGSDGVRLFDVDGKLLRTLSTEATGSASFSPDGSLLMVRRANYGPLIVHDLEGAEVWTADEAGARSWLPDGRIVIDGYGDGLVLVDPRSGKTETVPREGDDRIDDITPSADGSKLLLLFRVPPRVTVIDLSGNELRRIRIPGSSEPAATITPDGRILTGMNWQKKILMFMPVRRFAVRSTTRTPGKKKPKVKEKSFDDRAAADAEAAKQEKRLSKKGYAFALETPELPEAERLDTERIERIRLSKLAPVLRTAFVPRLGALSDDAPARFGGAALLASGEAWPACPSCTQPMSLLLEIDPAALPDGFGETPPGVLQVFYCTSDDPLCEVDTEAWQPGPDKSKLVRVLDATGAARASGVPASAARVPESPRAITGWTPVDDAPGDDDIKRETKKGLDRALSWARLDEDDWQGLPRGGDKLSGWPAWVQYAEYPACPDCGEPMTRVLFQLESGGACGWQFGDLGRAYVIACPAHPTRVDLVWQGG